MCVCVCVHAVGQVVHTLPEGEPVQGVTSLGEEIYVLRQKETGRDAIEVYDIVNYLLQRCLTVPDIRSFTDMTSCEYFLCLYISDHIAQCVHSLDLGARGRSSTKRWPVDDEPSGLSVNAGHNLIVACYKVRKIKEFSPSGTLLRDVILPADVINPWHAIQLADDHFIVCHGSGALNDPNHRVCKVSSDGRHVVHSHGGRRGSDIDQYNGPAHLAVDNNQFLFVADVNNRRVTLLSPTLNYICQVVSSDQVKWRPMRLYLDARRRRLYVADNEWKNSQLTAGRAVVFSV